MDPESRSTAVIVEEKDDGDAGKEVANLLCIQ